MIYNDLFSRIQNLKPSFNNAFLNVADYILNNKDELKYLRIRQLSEKCNVSEATITRFVKKIGFSSFHNFKMTIAQIETISKEETIENTILGDIEEKDDLRIIISKIKNEFISTIESTTDNIDIKEIEQAIDVISKAKTISYYCSGNSSIAAKHAFLRFYRAGISSRVYTDPAEMGVSASLLGSDDVAIGISYSGKTNIVIKSLEIAKKKGATTIAITGPNKSPLIKLADIKLSTRIEELDNFQISSFSRLSQIVLLDIIYAGVAVKNFDNSKKAIQESAESVRKVLNN